MKKTALVISLLVLLSLGFEFCYSKQDFTYNDFNKRDPLLPLVDSQGNPRTDAELFRQAEYNLPLTVKVSGIMFSNNAPFAVINGKVVKEVDSLSEGLVLTKINLDNIILTYGNRPIKISIGGVKKDENK